MWKRISKIYNLVETHTGSCVNRGGRGTKSGILTRLSSRRGLTLPEAVVSVGIFSMFMTVCCGSIVQYQTAFGRMERSMTYTAQLQVGLDMMLRQMAESDLSTFTNEVGLAAQFPIDLKDDPVFFRTVVGTNIHGDNIFSTDRIKLYVDEKDQLVQEMIGPTGAVSLSSTKTLATHVEAVTLSRIFDGTEYIPNALSASITSVTLLSSKEQAMRNSSGGTQGNTATSLEKTYVTLERVVHLKN